MIAIKTDISDSIDTAPSEVEVEQTQTINEVPFLDIFKNNLLLTITYICITLTSVPSREPNKGEGVE